MSTSAGYAQRLSPFSNTGDLNLANVPDPPAAVVLKVKVLAARIREAEHVVIHSGAGLSTSAGINDFRGPNGIWTQQRNERLGKRRKVEKQCGETLKFGFENARPTLAHMAIVGMYEAGLVQYVISQNVDGLHLRSGLPRDALSELHGNLFMEWCPECKLEYSRDYEVQTAGFKPTGNVCKRCGGILTDKTLDWEDSLPEQDLERALSHSSKATLSLVVGTSCQMDPARQFPFRGVNKGHGVALCNLSKTNMDDRIGICIREQCDIIFALLAHELDIAIPVYARKATLNLRVTSDYGEDQIPFTAYVYTDIGGKGFRIPWIRTVRFSVQEGDSAVELQKTPEQIVFLSGKKDIAQISAVAILQDGRKVALPGVSISSKGITSSAVTVDEINYTQKAEELRQKMKTGSKESKVSCHEPKVWFIKSSKKRWVRCIRCKKEVWPGNRNTEGHLQKCMNR